MNFKEFKNYIDECRTTANESLIIITANNKSWLLYSPKDNALKLSSSKINSRVYNLRFLRERVVFLVLGIMNKDGYNLLAQMNDIKKSLKDEFQKASIHCANNHLLGASIYYILPKGKGGT